MNKRIKKIITIGTVLTALLIAILTPFSSNPTFADNEAFVGRSGTECPYILGMVSWDCNVNVHDESSLKSGIWTIAANVATDLTVITAYLVIGYVIYGGYLYMMSSGDPGKIATGKKTLVQAFIGLGIVLLANVIINAIRIALGNVNLAQNCAAHECANVDKMVVGAIEWVIGVAGVVALIFVVIGGISYMTSAGDPGKTKRAKDTILYSLIGLVIVALSFVITAFVASTIRGSGDTDTSHIDQSIITKEITPNVKTN